MKIIMSCPYWGGRGGQERLAFHLAESLSQYDFTIIAGRQLPRDEAWNSELEGQVLSIHDLQQLESYDYDLYIHLYRGPWLFPRITAACSILIPCGNDVRDQEQCFDLVVAESEQDRHHVNDQEKFVVICPPIQRSGRPVPPALALDSPFFLTVFNPYPLYRRYPDGHLPCKGHDVLRAILDDLPYPLIWCHSQETVSYDEGFPQHKNLIHMESCSSENLNYLYDHCEAYLAFSREEGFGFAIADAFVAQKPVLSRRIGVCLYFTGQQGLVHYETIDEMKSRLRNEFMRADYDLSPFQKHRFAEALFSRCAEVIGKKKKAGLNEARKISVIITCHGKGPYLLDAMESVSAQTLPAWDVVFIDDGCREESTHKALSAIRTRFPQVKILRTENSGVSHARNTAINVATGDFIVCLDGDDWLAPTYLETLVRGFDGPNVGIVSCDARYFGARNGPIAMPAFDSKNLLFQNTLFVSCMFPKAIWKEVGGFNNNMVHGLEDHDFWLSIVERDYRVEHFKQSLFFYRYVEGSRLDRLRGAVHQEMRYQLFLNHREFYSKHLDTLVVRQLFLEGYCEQMRLKDMSVSRKQQSLFTRLRQMLGVLLMKAVR